jgi:hypothetical protein
MVPWKPKITNFTLFSTSWVTSLPEQKPITFVPFHLSMNVISSYCVYKIKRWVDGSVERYKAYLVAKVFTKQEGTGYIKTFNPVVKPITVYFCCFPGLAD